MLKYTLHIIEFAISPGHIWGCLRMARGQRLSLWFGLRAAWWGQTGYDREPFTGPRWERQSD